MATFANWAEAFTIFAKYKPTGYASVVAEHDDIWAGPDLSDPPVSEVDKARLVELGWSEPEEVGYGWHIFV